MGIKAHLSYWFSNTDWYMEHVARGFIKIYDFMFSSKYNNIGIIIEQTINIALLIIITYMRINKGKIFCPIYSCAI